jgi:excisionase family DNA binding protein
VAILEAGMGNSMNISDFYPSSQGNGSEMMRIKAAATWLGCSVSTVYRAMAKEHLPAHRFGSHWVFFRAELSAWMGSLKGINLPTAS